jgi:hypothetical protein
MKKLNPLSLIVGLLVGGIFGYLISGYFQKKNATPSMQEMALHLDNANLFEKGLNDDQKANLKAANQLTSFKLSTEPQGPIDPIVAKQMIKAYQNQNADASTINPMLTDSLKPLEGFFIVSKYLKQIVGDTTNSGVNFYFAIKPKTDPSKHIYTLVYMAAKANKSYDPNKPNGANNRPFINPKADMSSNGEEYDFINPCPNGGCGGFIDTPAVASTKSAPAHGIKKP